MCVVSSVKCGRVVKGVVFLVIERVLALSSVFRCRVCEWEIITIFNILWHSNFIHVVRATHWKTRDCCIFHRFCFALSLTCSLAYFHVSHVLLASLSPPSVSSLCPSACLSHSAAAVSILYSVCYFWMKPSSRAASLWSFAEARPQLADCGSIVAMLIHRESLELAPKRERNGEKEMRQKNIQWHSRGCYSYRYTFGSKTKTRVGLAAFPFFPLKTST